MNMYLKIAFCLLLMLGGTLCSATAQTNSYQANISVFFSPNGGAEEALLTEIKNAQKEILIQAYEFTDRKIGRALLEAEQRGVDVRIICDKVNETGKTAQYSVVPALIQAGCKVMVDDEPPIAHSKVMIFDRQVLATGSYNFTKAANEQNVENLLIIQGSADLINQYIAQMQQRATLCHAFQSY